MERERWTTLACAKFSLGPNVPSPVMPPETQFWVEYSPTDTFWDVLQNVKKAFNITADVSLYLQNFYLAPTMSASLLFKIPDPVVWVHPSGHTGSSKENNRSDTESWCTALSRQRDTTSETGYFSMPELSPPHFSFVEKPFQGPFDAPDADVADSNGQFRCC